MSRPTLRVMVALAALGLAACGERSGTPADGAVQRDAGQDMVLDLPGAPDIIWWEQGQPPLPDLPWPQPDHFWDDTYPPDAYPLPDGPGLDGPPPKCGPFAGTIGKPCASQAVCGAGQICLLVYGQTGICSMACIPDDPSTPLVDEDNCPAGNACGSLPSSSQHYCFHKCTPQLGCSECAKGMSCHPSSGAYVGLRELAVCLYAGCSSGADCPVTTGQACSTTAASCPAGQTCQPKISGATDGLCAKAGVCDALSGLCGQHALGSPTAKVGDPCLGDVDCGGAMYCLYELDESKYLKASGAACLQDSECCSGTCFYGACAAGPCKVRYRNGYCTVLGCKHAAKLPLRACPASSDCNTIYGGGVCQRSCDLTKAADCRGHAADLLGDYECRAWNNIAFGGGAGSKGPVCDFGFAVPCQTWFSSKTDCSMLGLSGNSTNMACRDLKNNILANKYDANGFCLDDTASGSKTR